MDFDGISFADSLRRVFEQAKEELLRLGHEQLGAEHILLALLTTSDGPASVALDSTGVDRGAVRLQAESMFPPGNPSSDRGEVPYATTGMSLLMSTIAEARDSSGGRVSTGHLLLAALQDADGPSRRILEAADVNVADLAAAVRASIADDPANGGD